MYNSATICSGQEITGRQTPSPNRCIAYLLKTGSMPMPLKPAPETEVFPATPVSVTQAEIRPRNRGAEAQSWAMLSLFTLMPPAASSISELGLRTTCRRSPDNTVLRRPGSRLLQEWGGAGSEIRSLGSHSRRRGVQQWTATEPTPTYLSSNPPRVDSSLRVDQVIGDIGVADQQWVAIEANGCRI